MAWSRKIAIIIFWQQAIMPLLIIHFSRIIATGRCCWTSAIIIFRKTRCSCQRLTIEMHPTLWNESRLDSIWTSINLRLWILLRGQQRKLSQSHWSLSQGTRLVMIWGPLESSPILWSPIRWYPARAIEINLNLKMCFKIIKMVIQLYGAKIRLW